jgi:CheY-like chemotaxis protein
MVRILLVEDSDTEAIMGASALMAEGWDVRRVATVREAIEIVGHDAFDIAVLDYLLPDGDGLQVLDALRQRAPTVPVLFLTGTGSEEVAMKAMGHGAADYMVKVPGFPRSLPGRVAGVLARRDDLARVAGDLRQATSRAPAATLPPALGGPRMQAVGAVPAPPGLAELMQRLVEGPVWGAAVFRNDGMPLASRLPEGVDERALGLCLVGGHFQAQQAFRQLPGAGPAVYSLLHAQGQLVGLAPIPGPGLVAVLLDPSLPPEQAVERLRQAARRAWDASGKGSPQAP